MVVENGHFIHISANIFKYFSTCSVNFAKNGLKTLYIKYNLSGFRTLTTIRTHPQYVTAWTQIVELDLLRPPPIPLGKAWSLVPCHCFP